jgi:hypothetical protein
MKKSIQILLTLYLAVFFSQQLNAQAFQKGNKNIDVGVGLGIYGTKITVTNTVSFGPFSEDSSYTDTDGAASRIIPISFEYGVTDNIGVGLDLTICNYYIDEEDEDEIARVNSFDIGVRGNYHLLKAEKNDLMIGLGLGISSLNWEAEPGPFQFIDSYSGSGLYLTVGIADRIFLSEHIGILLNVNYRGYFYSALETELSAQGQAAYDAVGASFKQELDWNFSGVTFGTGVSVKF